MLLFVYAIIFPGVSVTVHTPSAGRLVQEILVNILVDSNHSCLLVPMHVNFQYMGAEPHLFCIWFVFLAFVPLVLVLQCWVHLLTSLWPRPHRKTCWWGTCLQLPWMAADTLTGMKKHVQPEGDNFGRRRRGDLFKLQDGYVSKLGWIICSSCWNLKVLIESSWWYVCLDSFIYFYVVKPLKQLLFPGTMFLLIWLAVLFKENSLFCIVILRKIAILHFEPTFFFFSPSAEPILIGLFKKGIACWGGSEVQVQMGWATSPSSRATCTDLKFLLQTFQWKHGNVVYTAWMFWIFKTM